MLLSRIFVVLSSSAVSSIGVNLSQRKSGTERTKKRKKRELDFFLTNRGAPCKTTGKRTQFYKNIHETVKWWSCITKYTVSESLISLFVSCNDVLPTSQSALALLSTWSWLPSRLNSTLRWAEHKKRIFFQLKYAHKKAGNFKWKAEKRDGVEKAWFYARKRYCWHLWGSVVDTWGQKNLNAFP